MLVEELVEEHEFAKAIHIPVSRLIKWRKYYGAPFHRVKRRVYYDGNEFWEWFHTDSVF